MPKIIERVTPGNVQEVMILHAALGSIGKVKITETMYQEYRENHDSYRIEYEYDANGDYTVEVRRADPAEPIPDAENMVAMLQLKVIAEQHKAARE